MIGGLFSFKKLSHIVAATVAVATKGPAAPTLCESLQLLFENRRCCKLLEGKVEMFSQFRSRSKDGLATFLCSKFGAGFRIEFALLLLPLSTKSLSANRVSAFSIQMVVKLSLCLLEGTFYCIHYSPKRLVESIQMTWTAIRSYVGIPLLRKKANSLL